MALFNGLTRHTPCDPIDMFLFGSGNEDFPRDPIDMFLFARE